MPAYLQNGIAEPLERDPIREARLAALRQSIAGGTYRIPASEVTDKLILHMTRRP